MSKARIVETIVVALLLCTSISACGSGAGESDRREPIATSGQAIHSSHSGPAPWSHVLTCYGGCAAPHYDSSACGHSTSCGPIADGSWWYATERAAFYCGAKLQLTRGDKCVVVDVQDNGPADWVEANAATQCGTGYIIDASPLVADYFGGGCGWGECFKVDVTPVADSTPTGPCQNCADSCGKFGCSCVDGQCNGGYCPGTGCSAQETSNCAAFGCGCVDHQCNGGYCDGSGCTAKEATDCGAIGCECADHQCSGGFACTAQGTGCTAKETDNCGQVGCGCADHKCAGGYCATTECGDQEKQNCAAFGCGCAKGQCSGGSCPDCTDEATANCAKFGCGCAANECSGGSCGGSGGDGGGGAGGASDGGSSGTGDHTGGTASAPWGGAASGSGGKIGSAGSSGHPPNGGTSPTDDGCAIRPRSANRAASESSWFLLATLLVFARRRARRAASRS